MEIEDNLSKLSIDEMVELLKYANSIVAKWTIPIVYILANSEDGARFNEIKSQIPGITGTTLTARLRTLEDCGVVSRTVVPDTPVRVEYRLTEYGMEVVPLIMGTLRWCKKGLQPIDV